MQVNTHKTIEIKASLISGKTWHEIKEVIEEIEGINKNHIFIQDHDEIKD